MRFESKFLTRIPNSTNTNTGTVIILIYRYYLNCSQLLDTLSPRVKRGGYIAWACAGAISETYSGATAAFDAVLEYSLSHIAKT